MLFFAMGFVSSLVLLGLYAWLFPMSEDYGEDDYDRGYDQGFVDGFDQGHVDGLETNKMRGE